MQNTNRTVITVGIVILIVIIGVLVFVSQAPSGPGKLDAFAQCLGTNGAKFYGAFWCPHCQNQKAMFGTSKQYLPYVECSTPDGQDQNALCTAIGVKSYPTWVFADNSTSTGEIPLATLAEKTKCMLPQI